MEIVLRSGESSQHQGDDELTRFQTCVGRCLSSFTPPLKVLTVRVLRRPVIRPDVQLLRLAIVAEGGD